jgi:hypothetical protein
MAAYNLIATTTVGSGGASAITFTSIPQTYTDLLVLFSLRNDTTSDQFYVTLNSSTFGSGTANSSKIVYGDGSSATSRSNVNYLGFPSPSNFTASAFGNASMYIPNYTGSTYKSVSTDSVNENNATAAYPSLSAAVFNITAAITIVSIETTGTGTKFVQYSSASLYGIKNS